MSKVIANNRIFNMEILHQDNSKVNLTFRLHILVKKKKKRRKKKPPQKQILISARK